jgi:hypothetical protein
LRNLFLTLFVILGLNQLALAISCLSARSQIENNKIILLGSAEHHASQIYFFKNTSRQSVFIDHVKQNPGASAGWSSYLRPYHWSALVLNQKNFTVSCVMIQPGKVIPLNCSRTLFICSPQNIIPRLPLKGNYWLVEDKPWNLFLRQLVKQGVKFTK